MRMKLREVWQRWLTSPTQWWINPVPSVHFRQSTHRVAHLASEECLLFGFFFLAPRFSYHRCAGNSKTCRTYREGEATTIMLNESQWYHAGPRCKSMRRLFLKDRSLHSVAPAPQHKKGCTLTWHWFKKRPAWPPGLSLSHERRVFNGFQVGV